MNGTDNPLLDAALRYAARGWYVFPLLAGLKVPLEGSEGWKDATTDAARIRGWWAENPAYNIGIATGPSHLMVIDVDPSGDWDALAAQHPELPGAYADAPVVNTPRGGFHVYLSGAGRTTASKISPHIDTRSTGGYVVAPPSRVTDGKANGSYGWEADSELCDPQPAPAALLERLKITEREAPNLPASDIAWDDAGTVNRAVAWLATLVETGQVAIEGCGGDQQTYETACKLLEMGIKPSTAHQLLLDHWNPHCSPPWSADDLQTKIENAWRYGEETKGGKAERPLSDEHAHLLTADQKHQQALNDELARFTPVRLSEARKNLKPLEWLVKDLIPRTGAGIFYGPSGTFKTFLLLDLALSVATGHGPNWWQGDDRKPEPVIFFAGEGPHALKSIRTDAWVGQHGIPGLVDKAEMYVVDNVPPIEGAHYWQHILDWVKSSKLRPAVIVLDTLSRALAGLDENSARDAARATSRMEWLARETGAFVVAIHHTGKDASRGSRGSSVWYANVDVVLECERPVPLERGINIYTRKVKDGIENEVPMRFEGQKIGESLAFQRHWGYVPTVEEKVLPKQTEEWLEEANIGRILLKSPMTQEHLAQTLAVEYGVNEKKVRSALMKARAGRYRAWVPDGYLWQIPDGYAAGEIKETDF